MTRLIRTYKLLISLCVVNYVVSSKWIVESSKAGKFLSVEDFKLTEKEFEENYKCDVYKTVQSPIRNKLFDGKTFYLTPSVYPKPKELTRLIELSGGTVERTRRSATRIQEGKSTDEYFILSTAEDFHLLSDVARMGKPNKIVCSSELIMKSIMTQVIDVEQHIINFY